MANSINAELLENLRLELRRGCLVLAVLAALRNEQYGYTLRKILTDQGMAIDEGTLYPLLRRLESQGLLSSEWREQDKRNKRFYRLSTEGATMLKLLLEEWQTINGSLNTVIERGRAENNAPAKISSPIGPTPKEEKKEITQNEKHRPN